MYSSLVLGKASVLILVCEIYLLSLHKRMRKNIYRRAAFMKYVIFSLI